MNGYIKILFLALLILCCKESPVIDELGMQFFGEKINEENVMDFQSFLAKTESVDSLENAKLKAKVSEVCQAKGCWMNLVDDGKAESSVFVQFMDYGFFMPKDIAGRQVIVEGVAYKSITTVDELRHYAEDKGQSEEEIAAIVEPKEELKFLASGVILLPEKKASSK